MSDHRRLQRALFRLQLDHDLAAAVLGGDDEAAADLGLDAGDLALLRTADLAGVTADPGGRRRTQVLANAGSEYTLTLACGARRDPTLLQAFAAAPELHAAVRDERPLPFAFAAYARRRAREWDDPAVAALATLEEALAHARRAHRAPAPAPPSGADLALVPGGALLELADGVFAHAEAVRRALDVGEAAPPPPPLDSRAREWLVLAPRPAVSVHALADVHVERLRPPADELLRRVAGATADAPFDAVERARFAFEHGAGPDDLEAFVDELVEERVLRRLP